MWFKRMPIEKESPEELGYYKIKYNLAESSIRDYNLSQLNVELKDLTLSYGPHRGDIELRELIAQNYDNVSSEQVLVTSGAAMAIFITYIVLLKPGDHVVVLHPNYGSNIEVPRSLGCKVDLLKLRFEEGFKLNLKKLEDLITSETKIVSLTYPNNPTGAMITEKDLKKIIEIIENHNCYLLFDETYREMTFGQKLPLAASLSPRAISIESLSKSYGLPGIRIGWLVTQDKSLMESFLAAKEQITICNSVVDEKIAISVLKRRDSLLAEIKSQIRKRLKIVDNWMNKQKDLKWIKPQGGVVCFPRIEANVDVKNFYKILFEKYRTLVGPGHWFGFKDHYFRLGYGWPSEEELKKGLENISKAIQETTK